MRVRETAARLLDFYAETARTIDQPVLSLPSLDVSQPLPAAPWFEPGAPGAMRRVSRHILAEIAHHAGHAGIICETIDGAKTMG